MKKIFFALLATTFALTSSIEGQQLLPVSSASSQPHPSSEQEGDPGLVSFTPPAGWMLADPSILPKRVKTMVVGKAPSSYSPSINLSTEPYNGTLKQYLKIVKNINSSKGYDWKDLGTIQTQSGTASLSQVDTKTQAGMVRLMHVILVKNGNVYILTAAALKDEFPIFYKDFFTAMRSLKVAKDAYEVVTDAQQRTQLKTAADKLQSQWQSLLAQKQKENPQMSWQEIQENTFNSQDFQTTIWNPFKEMLTQKYSQWGAEWQSLFLQKLEDQLFNLKS
jgi:hypothetical protein